MPNRVLLRANLSPCHSRFNAYSKTKQLTLCDTRAKSLQRGNMQLLRCRTAAERERCDLGRGRLSTRCQATSFQQQAEQVTVEVDKASRNARRLYAAVSIDAPLSQVWQALTDYEGLGNFIPGLAENRCLERRPQGAKLRQVGQQDIALGAKFRATVILDIQEYASGVPPDLCAATSSRVNGSGARESLFPEPRSRPSDGQWQDIAFSMIEGDFVAFRGIWRMQPTSPTTTRLSYALHVQPQAWLPVRAVQGRIVGEVRVNLTAVRRYSEQVYRSSNSVQRQRVPEGG